MHPPQKTQNKETQTQNKTATKKGKENKNLKKYKKKFK